MSKLGVVTWRGQEGKEAANRRSILERHLTLQANKQQNRDIISAIQANRSAVVPTCKESVPLLLYSTETGSPVVIRIELGPTILGGTAPEEGAVQKSRDKPAQFG